MMLCPLRLFLDWLGGRAIIREDQEIQELMKIEIARAKIKALDFVRKLSKQEVYIHPVLTDIELRLNAKGKWEVRGTVKTEKDMHILQKLNKELNGDS